MSVWIFFLAVRFTVMGAYVTGLFYILFVLQEKEYLMCKLSANDLLFLLTFMDILVAVSQNQSLGVTGSC